MNNDDIRTLALNLLRADSENEVLEILRKVHLWEDRSLWRLYGDKEGNFAQAGNQQALPEAALVEKIVNSVDARLMNECLLAGISPESDSAPRSVRGAVAQFFDKVRSTEDGAGTLTDWPKAMRTEQSRYITIAATGDRPVRGQRTRHMCLTVADQGEGQTPARLPHTILSLNAKNKQRVRFVQGKFNMGGTGALRFCGNSSLQLVISRRHPRLADRVRATDPTAADWAITVVRREEPSDRSGEPIHSEFTYLAPLGADQKPRQGEVLRFSSDTMPLMPEHDEPYARHIEWGTAIKLYEYETTVGQSNVLMKDGLLFALERLLPEIALPVRLHECRGYQGEKDRSFETPIAGLVVRLEDGKGDNLEEGFPISAQLQVGGLRLSARIYAFREDRAATYLHDEGVIFTLNGQAHGYLPKSIFTRPKAVGLPRLRDSLLLLMNCSTLSVTQREDLFMSSRDRLSKKPIRFELEREIEQLLRTHPELRRLQQQRRERDVESRLSEEKPLEEVLGQIFTASPTLKALFLRGQRLTRPFASGSGGDSGDGSGAKDGGGIFQGRRHPTYFRIPGISQGDIFKRNCEQGRRCRLKFETDAENGYFDRPLDPGTFELEIVDSSRNMSPPSFSVTLENGSAILNMALPVAAAVGDELSFQATVNDSSLHEGLVSMFRLTVDERRPDRQGGRPGPKPGRRGAGEDPSSQGITLPPVIAVRENDKYWTKYHFDAHTACHVISDPVDVGPGKSRLEHTFYINVDNTSLKTEMKYSKQDARLLEAKFKYANVLLGLAILHEAESSGDLRANDSGRAAASESGNDQEPADAPVQDTIRNVSSAIAPVLLPIIDQLSGLNEEHLEELSSRGEDA